MTWLKYRGSAADGGDRRLPRDLAELVSDAAAL
jgi:hypothetical protein